MNTGELLAENARRSPHRTALLYDDESVSFGQLDRRADRVAAALTALGVEKGDRVAVFSRNRPEWVEIFFGAARTGAVLVPINFRLGRGELAHILEETKPKIVFFEEELGVPEGFETLSIDTAYGPWRDAATSGFERVPVDERYLHSIGYTSGTTGVPKGAALTHANVVVGTHRYSLFNIGYGPDDVFLNPTPLCHRAGWARLVQSVGVGAPHVLLRKFDPERVFDLIDRHRVTMSGFVPTMVRLMAEHGRGSVRSKGSTMRKLLTTGEACPPAIKETIFELFPGVELVTSFASTEAGIMALLSSKDTEAPAEATGRPLPEVEMSIADDGEILVRTGEPGTGGVMLEYWNDPEANAEAFRGGWFHTGDCGELDEAGYLYVTDRKKDMILSGGLNIYSKEVESCLLAHPAVLHAAVVGKPDSVWGESVVAFVVRRKGRELDADGLVAHCKEHLASYKKPKEVRFVEALPTNAAGKVLKYELRRWMEEKRT